MLEAELPPKFNDLMAIVFLIIDQLCVMCQDEETTRREGFTASTFLFYFLSDFLFYSIEGDQFRSHDYLYIYIPFVS